MVKYVIYAALAVLILWSVWYLGRRVARQLRGECGCGGTCGDCGSRPHGEGCKRKK